MVDEYKDKVKRLQLTETINALLEMQGTDLSEFLDHNQISNLLIDCRDEILRLTACLRNANENFEHFEREWYLANDRVEVLEKTLRALIEAYDNNWHPMKVNGAEWFTARAALEKKDG